MGCTGIGIRHAAAFDDLLGLSPSPRPIMPVRLVVVVAAEAGVKGIFSTHCIDSICWFAGGRPAWVTGDLEEGYEDDTEYAGDGGHDPATEPGANAYIKFDNGVGGFYVVVSKTTPGPKFSVEVAEVIPRPNGLSVALKQGRRTSCRFSNKEGF